MNCTCVHCLWEKEGEAPFKTPSPKKMGVQFTEFFRQLLNDNIQYADVITTNAKLPGNRSFDIESRDPFESLNESERVELLENLERANLARANKNCWPSLVYHTCQISPPCDGAMYTKVYEDKIQIGWRWKNLHQYAPPMHNGQRETLRLSQKSRLRLLSRANALARHYEGAVFVTLTYKKSVCQTTAKSHFDRWWKRVKNWTGYKEYVWVAELQKRGVIHFHILVQGRLDANWIQDSWRAITQQEVYTHVGGIGKCFAYMAKYMSKSGEYEPIVGRRWGCSRQVTQWCQPLYEVTENATYQEFEKQRQKMPNATHYDWMSTAKHWEQICAGWDNLEVYKLLKK